MNEKTEKNSSYDAISEMFANAARRHPGASIPCLDLRIGEGMIRDNGKVYARLVGCEGGSCSVCQIGCDRPESVRFDDLAAVRYLPPRPAEPEHYVMLAYCGRSVPLFGSPSDCFVPALPAVPERTGDGYIGDKCRTAVVEWARKKWSDKHDFDVIDVSEVPPADLSELEDAGVVYEYRHIWHYVEE